VKESRPQSKPQFSTLKDKWDALQQTSIEQGPPSIDKATSSNTQRKKSNIIKLNGLNSPSSPSFSHIQTFQEKTISR